jgi:hypothetical protein
VVWSQSCPQVGRGGEEWHRTGKYYIDAKLYFNARGVVEPRDRVEESNGWTNRRRKIVEFL